MEQIVVKVFHPTFVQLLLENGFHFVLRGHLEGGEFRRQQEALPRVTLDQGFPDGGFGSTVMIHIRGIKVGEPPLQKKVCHLLELFQVNVGGIAAFLGQAHQAKSQFFDLTHGFPPCCYFLLWFPFSRSRPLR